MDESGRGNPMRPSESGTSRWRWASEWCVCPEAEADGAAPSLDAGTCERYNG